MSEMKNESERDPFQADCCFAAPETDLFVFPGLIVGIPNLPFYGQR